MSAHQEEGGDAARTERPHRADGGDASTPLVIRGERYFRGKDEDTGESAVLIPFATGRGPPKFKLVTLPTLDVPRDGAITDWLNFTFPMESEGMVHQLVDELVEVLGQKASPAVKRRAGKFRYQEAIDLGVTGCLLCYGGNAGTGLISLSGEACALVRDWSAVVEMGERRLRGRITRWDGAVDDYAGTYAVEWAVNLWEKGFFGTGGNQPKMRQVGNWHTPDDCGRTVYIGRRQNGKSLRVYEKGMQLGAPGHPWVRWELTLGNKSRIVPWEVLMQPGQYFVGGYPKALAWMNEPACRIRTLRKQSRIGYDALTAHAKRAYGRLIGVMLDVEGSADKVVEKLQRDGKPKRLQHPASEDLGEWRDE